MLPDSKPVDVPAKRQPERFGGRKHNRALFFSAHRLRGSFITFISITNRNPTGIYQGDLSETAAKEISSRMRMVFEMFRPTVVNLLGSMLRSNRGNLRIHQITVDKNAPMAGNGLSESGLKDNHNPLVLGAKHGNEEIRFNPSPELELSRGMTLIVMDDVDDFARNRKML